jgi:hypothetical protein
MYDHKIKSNAEDNNNNFEETLSNSINDDDNNIICHIVGLNYLQKKLLKNNLNDFVKKNYIIIKDLDDLTKEINNNPSMISLVQKINKLCSKKVKNDNIKDELQLMQKQIYTLWKNTLVKKLNQIISNQKSKKFIILGLSVYSKDLRYKININSKYNFLHSLEPKKNAQEIIAYYLDKYRDKIIDGTFPLELLDINNLINRRERIYQYYLKIGYEPCTMDYIYDTIQNYLIKCSIKKTQNNVYIGLPYKCSNKIVSAGNMDLNAYNEEWLSIINIIHTSKTENLYSSIKKGYSDDIPYIVELKPNALNKFNTSGYLYTLDVNFFDKIGEFKYKIKKNIKEIPIISTSYIPDLYKKLKAKNINIISYSK